MLRRLTALLLMMSYTWNQPLSLSSLSSATLLNSLGDISFGLNQRYLIKWCHATHPADMLG